MDIVERLRTKGPMSFQMDWADRAKAADEIERLRKENAELVEALSVVKGVLSEYLPSEKKCEMAYNYLAGVKHDGTY